MKLICQGIYKCIIFKNLESHSYYFYVFITLLLVNHILYERQV